MSNAIDANKQTKKSQLLSEKIVIGIKSLSHRLTNYNTFISTNHNMSFDKDCKFFGVFRLGMKFLFSSLCINRPDLFVHKQWRMGTMMS